MNNVFSPKRFGNYFIYDLRNAWHAFGIPAIVLSLSPFIIFTLGLVFRLVSRGAWTPDFSLFGVTYIFVLMIATLAGPTAMYGKLTEKRYGTDFLMLPASTFEKWASMMLILCVVYPAVFFALLLGSDALLNTLFPDYYNSNIISNVGRLYEELLTSDFSINLTGMSYLNWCSSVLTFALGALCFKKAKIAKTILVMFALTIVFGIGFGLFLSNIDSIPEWMDNLVRNEADFIRLYNIFMNVMGFGTLALLSAGTYFRLKTIKH